MLHKHNLKGIANGDVITAFGLWFKIEGYFRQSYGKAFQFQVTLEGDDNIILRFPTISFTACATNSW